MPGSRRRHPARGTGRAGLVAGVVTGLDSHPFSLCLGRVGDTLPAARAGLVAGVAAAFWTRACLGCVGDMTAVACVCVELVAAR